MSNRKPWHRRPDETERAFFAFQCYLEMPPPRVINTAYGIYTGGKTYHPNDNFSAWVKKNHWDERAAAYDNWIIETRDAAKEKALAKEENSLANRRIKINEQAWEIRESLIEKVRAILKLPITKQEILHEQKDADGRVIHQTIKIEPVNFRLRDAGYLLEIADRIGRLATGMETDRVAVAIRDELRLIATESNTPYEEVVKDFERASGMKLPDQFN
jgi:hypothetical protein